MSNRKYEPGGKILDFKTLLYHLSVDNGVYIRHKWYHRGWVMSHQLRYITSCINGGHIRIANKIINK